MINNVTQLCKYLKSLNFVMWNCCDTGFKQFLRMNTETGGKNKGLEILVNYTNETCFWFYAYTMDKDIASYFSIGYTGEKNNEYAELSSVEDLVYFL